VAAGSSTPQEAARIAQVIRVDHQAEAARVDHPPSLNGTLDDPLWQSGKTITAFRQREPNESDPATEKTEVRVLYTRTAVYFGFIAMTPNRPGSRRPNCVAMRAKTWTIILKS